MADDNQNNARVALVTVPFTPPTTIKCFSPSFPLISSLHPLLTSVAVEVEGLGVRVTDRLRVIWHRVVIFDVGHEVDVPVEAEPGEVLTMHHELLVLLLRREPM